MPQEPPPLPDPPDESPKSRALDFDPNSLHVRRKKDLTAPLKPLTAETTSRPPVMIVLGVIVILGAVAFGAFWLSDGVGDENGLRSTADLVCLAISTQNTNVRMGPGYDYPRAWILPAGETRLMLEQVDQTWLRIDNGWLLKAEVSLSSSRACNELPEPDHPQLFDDDILPPPEIESLGWDELLGESFAVDVNGWSEAGDPIHVAVREGELILFSSGTLTQVYPVKTTIPLILSDAYYTFRFEWVASDLAAEVVLLFRATDINAYQVAVRRDGTVTASLRQGETVTPFAVQADAVPISHQTIEVGILSQGNQHTVYLNGEQVIRFSDATLTEGRFALGLQGRDSSLRISRFEIRIPTETNAE
jgi:hypothetical protein